MGQKKRYFPTTSKDFMQWEVNSVSAGYGKCNWFLLLKPTCSLKDCYNGIPPRVLSPRSSAWPSILWWRRISLWRLINQGMFIHGFITYVVFLTWLISQICDVIIDYLVIYLRSRTGRQGEINFSTVNDHMLQNTRTTGRTTKIKNRYFLIMIWYGTYRKLKLLKNLGKLFSIKDVCHHISVRIIYFPIFIGFWFKHLWDLQSVSWV